MLVTLDILLFVAVTGLLEYGQMGGRAAMSGAAKAAALNPVIVGTIIGSGAGFHRHIITRTAGCPGEVLRASSTANGVICPWSNLGTKGVSALHPPNPQAC